MAAGTESGPAIKIDLHCHTSASFDASSDPVAVARRARDRGLTHVLITDHDTIEGALRARDGGLDGITVIVGCEVLTTEGDLIVAFLDRPLPRGLGPREAIAAARDQGAAVGIPHPFDRSRRSLLRNPANVDLVRLVDWIETRNGRASSAADGRAGALARKLRVAGVAASDAHTLLEVGAMFTQLNGDIGDGVRLAAALTGPLVHGRGLESPSDAPTGGRTSLLPWRRSASR